MEKLVLANWKANLTLLKAEKWLTELSTQYHPVSGLRVTVAVPFPFLFDLRKQFASLPGISWTAQDVSSYPLGNYTGSVPAAWLNGQVEYVIVGHRERRKYFRETIQDVANKVSEALEENIQPILCVDLDTAQQQSASVEYDDMERLIVAYTPSDAEQLEISRSISAVGDGIEQVASLFPGASVLYGGGVNESNVAELFTLPKLTGVMVAGGCLDPHSFVKLLGNAADSLGLG